MARSAHPVYDLLKNKNHWCKSYLAINKNRVSVGPTNESAVKWCLLGAIIKVYSHKKRLEVGELVRRLVPNRRIVTFNDSRTHAQVLSLVKKAGI